MAATAHAAAMANTANAANTTHMANTANAANTTHMANTAAAADAAKMASFQSKLTLLLTHDQSQDQKILELSNQVTKLADQTAAHTAAMANAVAAN